ncbi:DUF4255 domain-containing protein [Desulfoluna spongiiphila]|uniref:Pvc16 N-terminal domain-containing protein n=1 Tax=Desulfoluna spongiiphila TaxID=419481 RepID=A0A1G5J1Q8_9BACT|nr:DUF4255 domain-containing protein [Desulfoluna spongiiphila]SCY82303.1 Protein of unknown function [Desulfoluna spongiiphila]
MSRSTAIGMVSESLRNLLLGEMSLTPEVGVTLLAPDEPGSDRRVNLFLYRVEESPSLKNLDWQPRPDDPSRLVPPPLSLHLFYLMTPRALTDPQTGNVHAHKILGEAMQVLHANPVVPATYLSEGLEKAREELTIRQVPVDLESMGSIWSTFAQPYRLSVAYEVSVVQIDMPATQERPMGKRVLRVGVPEVKAPFHPPEVTGITPMAAPAGTVVTVTGRHLAGWRAYISVMRRTIESGAPLSSDAFPVTIPADLAPGFYEMRIDISHLNRKTLFFEVTA